jgi:uncharacterized protein (TIRG00374 family)
MRSLTRNRLLWVAGVILMVAFLWWGRSDVGKMLTLRPLPLVLCFLLTLGMALTSVAKWRICLRSMGEGGAGFGALFHYFMIGRVLGLVVPMELGDLSARTVSLRCEHSISLGRGTYSVYLERSFDILVSTILLVPSALFILDVVGPTAGLVIAGVGFTVGLVCFALFARRTVELLALLYGLLLKAVCRIPWLRSRVDADAESKALAVADLGSAAPKLYLLSAFKFLLTAFRFASIAAAVGIGVGLAEIMLFAPGAQFALVFSVTPGGLGVVDWSWSGLLYKIGVNRHDIVPYLISLRAAVLVSVLVLAAASRLFYRKPAAQSAG